MKRWLSLLLVLVMILALASCGDKKAGKDVEPTDSAQTAPKTSGPDAGDEGPEQQEPENKELVVGISTDPVSWEPWGAFNNGRKHLMHLVYQTLTAEIPDLVNGTTIRYYVLASGYEQIDDRTYEVYVREGIYDTAGNPFTAKDAVFSYSTAKAQGTLAQLNAIESLEVVDDYTFRMTTSRTLAVGDFEDILTGFNMVTQASYESSPDGMVTTPVGTTGYVLIDYVAGSHAVFEKADSYWNNAANESRSIEDGYCSTWDCTKLDKIRYEIITDPTTMTIALESGDIDISANVSSNDLQLFQDGGKLADKFDVFAHPENMYGISFNASKSSPTNNYNLRMALAHCVDPQGVLDATFDGSGIVLKAWAYPTFMDYQNKWDDQPYFEYDLDLAKEYLQKFYDETGTTADTLKLRLLTQSGPTTGKIAEAVQAYIVTLVDNPTCVEILSFDRGTYNSMWMDENAFDILLIYGQTANRTYCTYAWNSYANAAKLQHKNDVWHSGDEKVQELLNAAISVKTHSDETVSDFQQYINDQAYIKNLMCGDVYVVGKSWIGGLEDCIGPKDCLAIMALDYDWSKSDK
ncbi:MAG TPA: ABC transporter substrate-binding protein [Clostridiales bacterium]|nr:ABC transporter substrate-binding protein [Clostridiales bacterium]